MTRILQALIAGYQRVFSGLRGRRCRYYPTCSEYASTAVRDFGPVRGVVLAAWRLLRCNPWTPGGVDHPRDQRIFR